ncbi:histidine--tRNA ligase [Eudoraea chungangensis]|uniref:histidine--tRNA ligase n=1 Tax=Eudoraea chungangensis TaxID=1481905 RepID=UPI0023ED773D|nr:histidine--tRNA ligase [Eudoraea chungangensis]
MASKPSIPKGTRDFSPKEIAKRNYIFSVIRKHFELFGFQPIETPSFENLDTLLGKYGEEGDRLIFKILNSGDFLNKVDEELYKSKNSSTLTPRISEKALRYDLTVPFARYVVMHQNEISFPFKRYQIQPVWRADRPQKGRFREFYQCDADMVGSSSLLQEIELIQLYNSVFNDLKLKGSIVYINHRKILSGIAEVIGEKEKLIPFTVALDKLDKIGVDKVMTEMLAKGISQEAINKANPLFSLRGSNTEKLAVLKEFLKDSEEGSKGIEELEFVLQRTSDLEAASIQLNFQVTLARGLNYYTGVILEVTPPHGVKMGSIGGGGRYDHLTDIFGLKNVSGVGISFGLDRIYLVLEELNLFPADIAHNLDVLILNFGNKEALEAMKILGKLRGNGIRTDLYPDTVKVQKQMKYANQRQVPYIILLGEQELEANVFVVKDMKKGLQTTYPINEIDQFLATL